MMKVRRSYQMYQQALRMSEPGVVKIQRAFRAFLQRKKCSRLTQRILDTVSSFYFNTLAVLVPQ